MQFYTGYLAGFSDKIWDVLNIYDMTLACFTRSNGILIDSIHVTKYIGLSIYFPEQN